MNRIRNMSFPDHDNNWTDVISFLTSNSWDEYKTIAPIEYCTPLINCFPNEWSYWESLESFDVLILHKGQLDRLKNNWLDDVENDFDYVYGNAVFNVYIKKELNTNGLKGHSVHFSIHTLINGLKKLLKIGKKFKADNHSKNILLVTANNCGNIGDDAITLASKDMLTSLYPQTNIVIDKGPASKELISKVDLVVLGGGGIFYDNCFYNAQNYCQYFLYAHEAGIKSCAIGIGAQGITTQLGIEMYKRSLDLAEFIVVRDQNSYISLSEKVKLETPVVVKQDVVYTLKSKGDYEIKKKTDKPLLLFSLLDASRMPTAKHTIIYQESQAKCMGMMCEHFEVKLLVQSKDDLQLFESLKKQYGLDIVTVDYEDVYKIINIYKQSDLVVTSRLHGFIFAAQAQVPVITVASINKGSKLGSMVFDSIPSAKTGYIELKKYSVESLAEKLEVFHETPKALIPSREEVQVCQDLAQDTKSVFKEFIAEI